MTQRRIRGFMGFNVTVLTGTPRMDMIINQNYPGFKNKVYEYLGVDDTKKILLYAPTWRKDRNDNNYGMDFAIVKKALEKRFGCEWVIAIRFHPNVYTEVDVDLSYVINATRYPDIQICRNYCT